MFLFLTGIVGADIGFSLMPNWQNPIIPLQAGTQITPLCDPRLNIPCLQQWVHLAQPFAVTPIGSMFPSMEYYVPAGVFDTQLPMNTRMSEDWTLYTPSFPGRYSRSRSRARTRYYTSKSRPGRIREVTTNASGRRTEVKEGESVFVPIEAVKVEGSEDKKTSGPLNRARKTSRPKGSDDTLKETDGGSDKETLPPTATKVQAESVPLSGSAVSPKDIVVEEKEEEKAVTPQQSASSAGSVAGARDIEKRAEERSVTPQQSASKPVKRTESQDRVSIIGGSIGEGVLSSGTDDDRLSDSSSSAGTSDVGADTTVPAAAKKPSAAAKPSATPISNQGKLTLSLKEDISAVSAQVSSSGKPTSGCVKIDKTAKSNNPEDSDFCETCNPHLKKGVETIKSNVEAFKNLGKLIRAVLSGATESSSENPRRDGSKRVHIPDLEESSVSGSWTRVFNKTEGGTICSPDVALQKIVGTFNTTCKPLKFEEFYPDVYCQSCQKNIPPEVMLSMMTIESEGKCNAINEDKKKKEKSMGLFQINAKVYTCKDDKINNNEECLLKPSNSLKCGIEVLSEKYNKVNPERKKISPCPQWTGLDPTERDRWRRAVAGYNSGTGWVDRAVRSVEGAAVAVAEVDRVSDTQAIDNAINKAGAESVAIIKFSEKITKKSGKTKIKNSTKTVFSNDLKNVLSLMSSKKNVTVKKVRFYKGGTGRNNLKNTMDDLNLGHTGKFAGRARKSQVSWEDLRIYFLMEKLLPGNKEGTGRKDSATLSNLAHTEAVLGQEVKGSPPGIVEFWSQYVKNKTPQECSDTDSQKRTCTPKRK